MIDLLVEPSHAAAVKHAVAAYSVGNREPYSGLYVILRAGKVWWVGVTPWRSLVASRAAPETLVHASGWTHFPPSVPIEDEGEDGKPPKRDNPGKALAGELKAGETVVLELYTGDAPRRARYILDMLREPHEDSVLIPKPRDPAWKDEEYLGPSAGEGLVLSKHLLPPFKGKTLHRSRLAEHTWVYWDEETSTGGMVAERALREEKEECQQQPKKMSAWTASTP